MFVGDLTDRGPDTPAVFDLVTSMSGQAICADFAVSKRWQDRNVPSFDGTFRGCLGAIRIPENCVVFDSGEMDRIGRML